jgi:glucokinase
MDIVLAVDLGGTNLRVAAVTADGKIRSRVKCETPRSERADDIVRAMVEAANECRNAEKGNKVIAIAAAFPGTTSVERGMIMKAPNLPALDGFRMAAVLETDLGICAIIENDANAAAVGENKFGASRGFASAIMITLGTGVGGGIIIDGKILRGIDGTAGEIGHICVEPRGAPCGCGSRGCVEQYASASAIVRLVNELKNQYANSNLKDRKEISSLDVYEAGKAGDELALEVFRQMGFYLGIATADLLNILNPEAIVIGGGAAAGWDLFMPHVDVQIRKSAYRENVERVKILRAELGDDAGIIGAAYLAFEKIRSV